MSNNILMMENRQLIPRWHTSRKVFQLHYLQAEGITGINTKNVDDYWLIKAISEWKNNPTDYNASDVYVRLIQEERTDHAIYDQVYKQLLGNLHNLSDAMRDIVTPRLRQSDTGKYYSTEKDKVFLIIKKLKSIVKEYPHDALTWLDLGFYYSIIGEAEKAEEAARIANVLAPQNPFIARGFSRFLLHNNEVEKAVWSLKKTGLSKDHPLIASALLSINNAFSMKEANPSDARKLIDKYQGDPQMLSELLASLGTLEIQNGAVKKGKKNFERALLLPTENVLTQSSWLHHKHQINMPNIDLIKTIESEVNNHYSKKDYDGCREKLMDLYNFQPYSVGSLTDAGYISMVALNEPQFVVENSLNYNLNRNTTFGELNNLLVAKIMLGNIDNVDHDLQLLISKADKSDEDIMGTLRATAGMVLLKQGLVEDGYRFYDESINTFKKSKKMRAVALAQYFFYLQVKESDPAKASKLKDSTLKLAKDYNIHELISGFGRVDSLNIVKE